MGPCRSINNGTNVEINPYSWNEASNLLFVDQPVGAGFSYGSDYLSSTEEAAEVLYKFLQLWFEQFPEYSNLDFHIFGESYAGHYDSPLLDAVILAKMTANFPTCQALLQKCANTNSPKDCGDAGNYCTENFTALFAENSDVNVYDVRTLNSTTLTYPSPDYNNYLELPSVLKAIGAKVNYTECNEVTHDYFVLKRSDEMGGHGVSKAIQWEHQSKYNREPLKEWFLGDQVAKGKIQSYACLTFASVYNAGHEVAAYQPEVALKMFTRWINNQDL
ncbi:10573_t:CDS:2 [Acaulospora colombiana]|uniref:10573_t:CDS:1 n=1 Tax=Acaulospora colombiana TaxID=27376 RepID=A0ACA9MIF9_9GLOM|nr:10573_t:CDS:2 [Acaulospora colombiana]